MQLNPCNRPRALVFSKKLTEAARDKRWNRRGMRAGRSQVCRMKSVDRGQEMPLELFSARSQHLHATAGVRPCRMHVSPSPSSNSPEHWEPSRATENNINVMGAEAFKFGSCTFL